MIKIEGKTITMTRGDTLRAAITINNEDGNPYAIQEGDAIRFACKQRYTDPDALILKEIPTDTLELHLAPEDTKILSMGKSYFFDIQLTKSNGDVDTFISEGVLKILNEVE